MEHSINYKINNNIKPLAFYQLANMYGVSPRTLRKWITPFKTEIGKLDKSRIYTIKQVQIIFENIGDPRDTDN